jgi:deazaflavin-dependent oxidoreductase (nitroreductase family)
MAVKPHAPRVGPVTRRISWLVGTKAGSWVFMNIANRVDPPLIKATRGYVRFSLLMPSLLLRHRGARTGAVRETPIVYFTDGDDVVLVASNGGLPRHPAWLHNLRATPRVQATTDGRFVPFLAHEATGDERDRLWRLACQLYPSFARYQERAGTREIPVVVLSRSATEATEAAA